MSVDSTDLNGTPPWRPYIFLSFSNKDIEAAKSLGKFISKIAEQLGLDFWAQFSEPITTDEYRQILDKRVKECVIFVLLSTQNSLLSREVRREISQAYHYDRPFIIYKLDEAIPTTDSGIESIFRDKQWIEVEGLGRKKSLRIFVEHLRDRLMAQSASYATDNHELWSELRSVYVDEYLANLRKKQRQKEEALAFKRLAWQDLYWQCNWDSFRGRPKRLTIRDKEVLGAVLEKLDLPPAIRTVEIRRFRRNKSKFSTYLKRTLEQYASNLENLPADILDEIENRRQQACISLLEAINTADTYSQILSSTSALSDVLVAKTGWQVRLDSMKSIRDHSSPAPIPIPALSLSVSNPLSQPPTQRQSDQMVGKPVVALLPPEKLSSPANAYLRWPWCPADDYSRIRAVQEIQTSIADLLDDYSWEDPKKLIAQFSAARLGSSFLHPLPSIDPRWKELALKAVKTHEISDETWLGPLLLHINISQFSNRRGLLLFQHGLSINNDRKICMPFRRLNQRQLFAPRGGGCLAISISGLPHNSAIPVEGKIFKLPGSLFRSQGFAVQLKTFIGSLQSSADHWFELADLLVKEFRLLKFYQYYSECIGFPAVQPVLKSLPENIRQILARHQGAIPISDRSSLFCIAAKSDKAEGIVIAQEGILLINDKVHYKPWLEIWAVDYRPGHGLRLNDLPMLHTLSAAMRQRLGIVDTAEMPEVLSELAAFLFSLKQRVGLSACQ